MRDKPSPWIDQNAWAPYALALALDGKKRYSEAAFNVAAALYNAHYYTESLS